MRITLLALAAALAAPPALAQTQGQTYAIGPSDFDRGYAQIYHVQRRWQADQTFYGDGFARAPMPRLVDCETYRFRDDPRCLWR